MRFKKPDPKNASSMIESAKKTMDFTLTLPVTEQSGMTIVRNIYECFRMIGDALSSQRSFVRGSYSSD